MRFAILAAAALSCAGCANQVSMQPMGLGYHGAVPREEAASRKTATLQSAPGAAMPVATPKAIKQTLGGKVLSAIALERVTGRKPDPRRFKELR